MAPEQVEGEPVTAAADLYALGVVIYEMVTGRLPFTGGSAMSVALQVAGGLRRRRANMWPDIDPAWGIGDIALPGSRPCRPFR